MKTIVSASLAGATLLGVAGSVAADTAVPTVPTYTATYEAEYKGKTSGLVGVEGRTSTTPRRLRVRCRRPSPRASSASSPPRTRLSSAASSRSSAGEVRPKRVLVQRRHAQRPTGQAHPVRPGTHIATVSDKDGRREVSLDDISLDDGSLYVALMQDLIVNGKPGQYRIADSEQAKTYGFEDKGEAQIDTGLRQARRPCATSAIARLVEDYLSLGGARTRVSAARIETRRHDEVQTASH